MGSAIAVRGFSEHCASPPRRHAPIAPKLSAAMTPSCPLLYTYRRCPYAMRARMALLMVGVPFEAFEIVLRDKPPAMLAASPKGTVPVLLLPGGRVLEQSWDIVAWALSQASADVPAQEAWRQSQTEQNQQLLHINDGDFKHQLDRYKYPERFAQSKDPAAVADCKRTSRNQAVETMLEPLERALTGQEFLGASQACATDLGIFPFVRQFAAVDPDWFKALPLPQVKTWLNHWQQSPLFVSCMHKLPSNTPMRFPSAV